MEGDGEGDGVGHSERDGVSVIENDGVSDGVDDVVVDGVVDGVAEDDGDGDGVIEHEAYSTTPMLALNDTRIMSVDDIAIPLGKKVSP